MAYIFENLLEHYKNQWYETEPIETTLRYTHTHRTKDKSLLKLKKTLIAFLEQMYSNDSSTLEQSDHSLIKSELLDFMTNTLDIEPWVCETLDQEGYYEVTRQFYERAKKVCPNMALGDINQAMRNMWVIIALQIYMGLPVQLTSPAFAYSMLYPLTDNYMDNSSITKAHKQSFNQRFYEKIKNNINNSYNEEEALIFEMIDLITDTYKRSDYPEVINSLLAILDGQNKSLDQHKLLSLYQIDLLGYTFYKGGTSVLADAYLVRGTLNKDEALFAYGYGVVLQIADDLEDIDQDLASCHSTLANTQLNLGPLDTFFNQYRSFLDTIFRDHFKQETKAQIALGKLMSTSLDHLLMSAVYKNSRYFTKSYMRSFEASSRFSKKAHLKLNKKIGKLMAKQNL